MIVKDLVIGIDSSTTACKALAWDRNGTCVAEGRESLAMEMPRPAWHEQNALHWWNACVHALQQVTQKISSQRIAAVCITPQRETFTQLDEDGNPLRPAILWMDERSREMLPEVSRGLSQVDFHQITGKPLSGNLAVGKIAWLRKHEPTLFAQTARFLDVASFLNFKLTEKYRTGWGCVDPLGLFDMQKNAWSETILDTLGISQAQLPEAFPAGKVLGEVSAEAAAACGLIPGVPVIAGVGDGQSAGLGINISSPAQAYLNLGTAVLTGSFSKEYLIHPAFRSMYAGLPQAYSLETVLLGGTYTVSWFVQNYAGVYKDQFGKAAPEEYFEGLARTLPAGSQGLVLVPYWNSAMNPYWNAAASGIIAGWRGIHKPQHLYRAILEGIGFELRLHLCGVENALGHTIQTLVAIGGGSKSALWLQIIADITGKPVSISPVTEAAALGAGIHAAVGAGWFSNEHAAAASMSPAVTHTTEPIPANQPLYDRIYDRVYRHLYPALQPLLNELTSLTEDGAS